MKLDAAGNLLRERSYGAAGSQSFQAGAIDLAGNTILVGAGAGSINLGGGLLSGNGTAAALVLKLSP